MGKVVSTPTVNRPCENRFDRRAKTRRRGTVILIVAVFLFFATFITISLTTAMVREHRQMRLRQRQLQAVWLAESGIERAAAQLGLDSRYQGETWTLTAETAGQDFGGVVEIQIQAADELDRRRVVTVVADYPNEPPHRARHRKTVVVDLPDTGGSS
jgi:hypothetical protein